MPRIILITGLLMIVPALIGGCKRVPADDAAVERIFGGPGLGAGEFSYPRSIAVSPVDGSVFIVDKTARIQRFTARGQYEHQWRMPEWKNGKPTGLTVDRENRVWVPDTHYHRVIVFDPDGVELTRFGERGEGPGQFIFPTTVALDAGGNIYVGEYGGNDRISKFTPEGQYLFSFAGRSDGASVEEDPARSEQAQVERPTEIAIDNEGILWVADACHHRICRYDSEGRFLSEFGMPGTGPGELNYPYGLALEKSGSLLIADRGNNRLVRWARDGVFLGAWGTHGRGRGQVAQPWDVAISAGGRVYCLDSWNNRVQLIDW